MCKPCCGVRVLPWHCAIYNGGNVGNASNVDNVRNGGNPGNVGNGM